MLLLIFWILCAGLTCYLADRKGRNLVEGILLGFLLGLIGLTIEIFLPSHSKGKDDTPGAPDA